MKNQLIHIARRAFAPTLSSGAWLALLLMLLALPVRSQQADKSNQENDIDSTLLAYFERCKEMSNQPVMMSMCDTLFRMAGALNDTRMQCVALCTKADYYNTRNVKDSLMLYLDEVMAFARRTGQLRYYYFAWGKRKINYYIRNMLINTALYEVQRLIEQAERDHYAGGLANGYYSLSIIYNQKGLYQQAAEMREREISTILENDLDDYNLSNSYTELGNYYSSAKLYDKAEEALKRALETSRAIRHTYHAEVRLGRLHILKGEPQEAKRHLDIAQEMLDTHKELISQRRSVIERWAEYYSSIGQYDESLKRLKSIRRASLSSSSPLSLAQVAEIHDHLGQKDSAIAFYKRYIYVSDSIRTSETGLSLTEYSTLLDVNRLNNENLALETELYQKNRQRNRLIIGALLVLTGILGIFFGRENRLNRRLRHSEQQLLAAKKRAEQASVMKTEFIQNMSHEIRTPLNSIVGFSQVLGQLHADDPETCEYSRIIETGSNNLVRLVDDVLDISNLDTLQQIELTNSEEVGALCQIVCQKVEELIQPGVELHVEAGRTPFVIQTHAAWLMNMLRILLQNAAKFTAAGSITLAWQVDEPQGVIRFTVSDTGIGIPADRSEYIFERFAKLNPFSQGAGLGLSIARLCAEKMGGSLRLDTSYTAGARFVLELPL